MSYFEKYAIELYNICDYVIMNNPNETYSSIIGNLLNAFVPAGIQLFKSYISNLKISNKVEYLDYFKYISHIEEYFDAKLFYEVVDTLLRMNDKQYNSKFKYCWLYTAVNPYDFFTILNIYDGNQQKKDSDKYCILKYYKKNDSLFFFSSFYKNNNFYGFYNEFSNIYY